MSNYIVITDEDLEELVQEVNRRMDDGYIPEGGVCHSVWVEIYPTEYVKEEWSQAMWK